MKKLGRHFVNTVLHLVDSLTLYWFPIVWMRLQKCKIKSKIVVTKGVADRNPLCKELFCLDMLSNYHPYISLSELGKICTECIWTFCIVQICLDYGYLSMSMLKVEKLSVVMNVSIVYFLHFNLFLFATNLNTIVTLTIEALALFKDMNQTVRKFGKVVFNALSLCVISMWQLY